MSEPAVLVSARTRIVACRQLLRRAWLHPRRELVAHGGLLLLLLALVQQDLRGRLGLIIFLGAVAVHVSTSRGIAARARAPGAASEQKG